jgi:hypothetical protein
VTRLVTSRHCTETYRDGALADRGGVYGQAAIQTQGRGLKDLIECQAGVAIRHLVRVNDLRKLPTKEEVSLAGVVDSEEAVPRTGASVRGQRRDLHKRCYCVWSIGEDPDQVCAQVWDENICICRVDDDLVRVAAILARGNRPSLGACGEDCLNWAASRQSAVLPELKHTHGARVAT